jgi:hypothetical protein
LQENTVREAQSVCIAYKVQLTFVLVQYLIKKGGQITGIAEVVKLYTFRDENAKGLNESCKY